MIPVHSYFHTNQSGFTYELSRIGVGLSDTALSYFGSSIGGCEVTEVCIRFETSNARSPAQIGLSDCEVTVSSSVFCGIENQPTILIARYGPTSANDMDPKVSLPIGFCGLLKEDRGSTSGLYWADQLLKAFWSETLVAITKETIQESATGTATSRYNLSSGFITLNPSSSQGMDINNESFFSDVEWIFLDQAQGRRYTSFADDEGLFGLARNKSWPNVWSEVDRLGKAMVSANYFDLGQWQLPSKTNMLSTPESLQFWTTKSVTIAEQNSGWVPWLGDYELPLLTYDDAQKNNDTATGFLNTTASFIAATYMCQDPVLKSRANVLVSILVADLVFLRTAWSLYTQAVGYFLKSRHPDANICDDCLARKKEDETLAKRPITSTIASTDISEQDIEMRHPPAQRPSAGQHESTQNLLTHRSEEVVSLLGASEDVNHHETDWKNLATTHTSSLGS